MRSLRLLAFIILVSLFAASPLIGRWVTTASASTGPMTARPEAVSAPANDNEGQEELCDSGNPRKQKKCNFNAPNADNDNNHDGVGNQPPAVGISVSNSDPNDGDTISFTVNASGHQIDQVWWWIPDYVSNDDNDNDSFSTEAHTVNCDGNDSCSPSSNLTTAFEDTFTIHAKARDRQGRESSEVVTEVRVH